MKNKIHGYWFLLLASNIFCHTLFAQSQYYQATVYFISGVQRNVTATDTSATVTASDIQTILTRYAISGNSIYPSFPEFRESDTLKVFVTDGGYVDSLKQMDKAKVFELTVSDTTSLKNLILDLQASPKVLFAEVNGTSQIYVAPIDPLYHTQWNLNNQTNPGMDIHAEAAWDIFKGNPNSIIAVVDYGVDFSHPDLSAKKAGGDNSYVVTPSNNQSHGTMIAGVAAATTNTNVGIAGVDWNAKILSKDINDYWDNCICINYFRKKHGENLWAQKITEAVDFSPNVWTLNTSWGENPVDKYSAILREAFGYAYKNNRVTCAAVNDQGTYATMEYPAGFNTGLIAVGGTDITDEVSVTHAGPFLDVLAPGQNIPATNYNNSYTIGSGTSFASAQVAGLASLMKGYNTTLNNDDIEQIIKLSCDLSRGQTLPVPDNVHGYGRINAFKALQLLQTQQIQHLTTKGGNAYSISTTIPIIMLGVLRVPDLKFSVKRIEVRTTVNLPTNYCSNIAVWGTGISTTGYRDDGTYCYGEGFCEVVPGTQTSTQVTLRTYVYQLMINNQYYPRAPQDVTFSYTTMGLPQPVINGDNMICATTSNPYNFTSLPANASVAWSGSPTGIAQINTPNANSTTITKLGAGSYVLSALVTNGCGTGQNFTANKSISIGGPAVGIIYGTAGSCSGSMQPWQLTANPVSYGSNWHWTVGFVGTGSSIYILSPYSSSTIANVTGGGTVNLNYTDLCGTARQTGVTLYSSCHSMAIIAPNPTTGMVSVSTSPGIQTEAVGTTGSTPWKIYQINVADQTSNVIKIFKYPRGVAATNIDLSSLPNGTYTLQFFDNTTWTSQQVIVLR